MSGRAGRGRSRAETALRSIERLLRAGTVFPFDVTVRDEPAPPVRTVEGVAAPEEHVAVGTALVARLDVDGPIVCVVHEADDDRLRLEMCAPVAAARATRVLPAGPMAVARHVGPYEEIGLAEHALRAWAEAHAVDMTGPLREVYLNDPATVAPDALETDVLLPISRRPADTPRTAADRR